ncbi:hypothetical protein AgCh_031331 [Apium graveolens]
MYGKRRRWRVKAAARSDMNKNVCVIEKSSGTGSGVGVGGSNPNGLKFKIAEDDIYMSSNNLNLRELKPIVVATKEESNVEVTNQNSIDVASSITQNAGAAVLANGDVKVLDNVATVKAQKVSKPLTIITKQLVSNGVANGCLA